MTVYTLSLRMGNVQSYAQKVILGWSAPQPSASTSMMDRATWGRTVGPLWGRGALQGATVHSTQRATRHASPRKAGHHLRLFVREGDGNHELDILCAAHPATDHADAFTVGTISEEAEESAATLVAEVVAHAHLPV